MPFKHQSWEQLEREIIMRIACLLREKSPRTSGRVSRELTAPGMQSRIITDSRVRSVIPRVDCGDRFDAPRVISPSNAWHATDARLKPSLKILHSRVIRIVAQYHA